MRCCAGWCSAARSPDAQPTGPRETRFGASTSITGLRTSHPLSAELTDRTLRQSGRRCISRPRRRSDPATLRYRVKAITRPGATAPTMGRRRDERFHGRAAARPSIALGTCRSRWRVDNIAIATSTNAIARRQPPRQSLFVPADPVQHTVCKRDGERVGLTGAWRALRREHKLRASC